MKKSQLKALIKEIVSEVHGQDSEISRKAAETILFLREHESTIAETDGEKQQIRQVIGMIWGLLTDKDYKRLSPGTQVGKLSTPKGH